MHSGCKIGNSYAGVSLIIRNDFEILNREEIHKGRMIKIECKNKATQSLYNIVGFYGLPSSSDKNVKPWSKDPNFSCNNVQHLL